MPRRSPRYQEIEDSLRERLSALRPGDPLPSENQLAAEFAVSRMTARAAVLQLAQEGLVVRVPGRGTFVAEGTRLRARPDGSADVDTLAAVFDLLSREEVASVSRVAAVAGTSRGDAQALLASLERHGLVERDPRGQGFSLGLGLLRLGAAAAARLDERRAARPVMEEIHEATGETVYLCVRRGFAAVCIERLDGLWVQSMVLRLGGALPLHLGAAPRTLLAHESREFWQRYFESEPLERRTPRTPATIEQVVRELEQVLEVGYSISDEDVMLGFASVGAPVFDHEGRIRAAISVGGPRLSILGERAHEIVQLITEGAARASRSLGHGEP